MAANHFFYFVVYVFLLQTILGIQVIDDVWHDDFAYDYDGLNGWYIYYQVNTNENLNYTDIPFVNGSLGTYHGAYQRSQVSSHYLKRMFQCNNDSSIKLGYTMAYCGNQQNDHTQVYLDDYLTMNINLSNSLYPLNDALINSTYSCEGNQWRVYYDVSNAQQMQSFISGYTPFDVTIEVKLSKQQDIAAINNITIFCEPPVITSSTIQPTTMQPNTLQPTTQFPTTLIPTTAIPTTTKSTSSSMIYVSTTKQEAVSTNYEGAVPSVTDDNTIISSSTSIALDNQSGFFNNMGVLIIVSVSVLCIFTIISIIIYLKIYSKKSNKDLKGTECTSNIQMNSSNLKTINKMGNNRSSSMKKLEIDDNSENSIDEMFEKPIVPISTGGEQSTENVTIGESVALEIQSNTLINDDSGKNNDSVNAINDNNDENDRSDTEQLYDNIPNITKRLEDDNNLHKTHVTSNDTKACNNEIIEGHTEKKNDNDFHNLAVWGNTTRGTDKGNDV